MMRIPPATDRAHADQVVGVKAQQHLPAEFGMPNDLGLGQSAHGFDPTTAKGLFDALTQGEAALVTGVPSGAALNGGASG